MEDIAEKSLSFTAKAWRYGRWPLAVFLILFAGLVIYRIPAVMEQKETEKQIAKIRATKLTLADVMGENLPPAPDPGLVDATVEGLDANQNGIRDDVELAIFEEYPDSARVRAALLQYALALQTQMTLDVVNKETFVATIENLKSGASNCIVDLFSIEDDDDLTEALEAVDDLKSFVEKLQYNTEQREKAMEDLYEKNLASFSMSNEGCDIDSSSLPD